MSPNIGFGFYVVFDLRHNKVLSAQWSTQPDALSGAGNKIYYLQRTLQFLQSVSPAICFWLLLVVMFGFFFFFLIFNICLSVTILKSDVCVADLVGCSLLLQH